MLHFAFSNQSHALFNLCFEMEGSNRKGVDCNGPQVCTQVRACVILGVERKFNENTGQRRKDLENTGVGWTFTRFRAST